MIRTFVWGATIVGLALALATPVAAQQTAPAGKPRWPSLDRQRELAGAEPGTALERLIGENQDFSRLRPEEASDGLPVPPWLRVLWRKAHPEGTYAAGDPTGGYPLVLKELYEWLRSHQDLVPGPREVDSYDKDDVPSPSALTSGEQRISGAQTSERSESDIRVNYWDPSRVIAASNNIGGSGGQAQFYSLDGGASWGQTSLALQPGDSFHSDPTVDWTSNGTAWTTTIGVDATRTVLHLRAYKSVDSGASWTFDATFSGSQSVTDKQIMWVDHSAASPYKDNIYVVWHNGTPAFFNRRTGPAGSWQTSQQLSGGETTGTAIGADIKTNANGDLFAFWPSTGNRKIFVVKSLNGGASFGAPAQLATTYGSYIFSVPAFANRQALIYVSAGAYRTATKDLVYATWADLSGEAGCTVPADAPGTDVSSLCKSRIWFSRSTNGGANWSAPVKINDQPGLNDQFNQWLVVDEATGALEVIYYDTVANTGRTKVDVWQQSSFDDGVTWRKAVKLTSAPSASSTSNQFGDYNGLSGIAGTFLPTWTDRRNYKEEIWTAQVADPVCTNPGAPFIRSVSTPVDGTVRIGWTNGAPSSSSFDVYRARGTCASATSFERVASQRTGSAYDDVGRSGGITYAYRLSGRDATANCESSQSNCVAATPTGPCSEPAVFFAGIASATNQPGASCGLALSWPSADACPGAITYVVFRTFIGRLVGSPPVATGLVSTSYLDDSPEVVAGNTYRYSVSAIDQRTSQPYGYLAYRDVTAGGPIATLTQVETFEGDRSGGGFDNPLWSHTASSGAVDWVPSTAHVASPTHSWFSASQTAASGRVLTTPPFAPRAGSSLEFWHTYAFETNISSSCFDAGTLEISLDDGANWSVLPDSTFTAGGFNGTVSGAFQNPLGGKRAWCGGTIGAMTRVALDLSPYAGTPAARLRWSAGDDSSNASEGWYVDSVTLANVDMPSACISNLRSDGFEVNPLPGTWNAVFP